MTRTRVAPPSPPSATAAVRRPPGRREIPPPPSTLAPPAPPIDPRLRARRIEVQRAAGRRRLRTMAIVGGAVGAVVAVVALTFSPFLAVRHVSVTGTAVTPSEVVADAAGLAGRASMVWTDLGDAERRVEALPWVADASVQRAWPNTVDISVTERQAAAVVDLPGGAVLVDRTGRVLGLAGSTATPALVTVEGLDGAVSPGQDLDQAGTGALTAALTAGPALGLDVRVVRWHEGQLEVLLPDDGVVRLGTADDLAAKLLSAATVLEDVDADEVEVLDVRVPEAPVLTRRP